MNPISDEQLRTNLERRSDDRLRADQRDALLAAVTASRQKQRMWSFRWPVALAPVAALAVLAVLLYPFLGTLAPGPSASPTGSQNVTAIPSGQPTDGPVDGITVYTAQQLSDMIGDPAWINRVVLAEAEISNMLAPPPLSCETPESCEVAFLVDVSGKNVVSLSWRDAGDGEGKFINIGPGKRLMKALAIPLGPGLFAFKVRENDAEYLGPIQMNGDQMTWTVELVQAGDHDQLVDDLFAVDGWLVQTLPARCRAPDVSEPDTSTEYWCGGSFVTQEALAAKSGGELSLNLPGLHVQWDAYQSFALDPHLDPTSGYYPRFGTYLVRSADCPPAVMGDCPVWRMVGRLDGEPPTAEPSPTLTASPTLAPVLPGWLTLGWAQDAAWSPDSARIAIMTGADTHVVDVEGEVVATYEGADSAFWIDSERLLLVDAFGDPVVGAPTPRRGGALYVVAVGSIDFQLIGYDEGDPLPSGTGLVAFRSDAGTFRVWSNAGWTTDKPGYPIAWSPANSDLAVLNLRQSQGVGLEGFVDVLDWPSLEVFTSDTENVTSPNFAHFDPAGEHLGFMSYGSIHILDFDSGHTSVVGPNDAWAWFGWDSQGRAVIGNERNFIGAYMLDGTEVRHWEEMGDSVVTTSDGSAMVFYNTDYGGDRPPMTLLSENRDPHRFDVSGTADRHPQLAPDGHAFLLFAYLDNHQVVLLSP